MRLVFAKVALRRCGVAFGALLMSLPPLVADDLTGDSARGAELYAERCARCHGVSIELVLAPEDGPRVATFLASHKTRFDQTRTDQDKADLAAYLVSLSPLQRN
nr:cytochrome c [uncultured Celeribacter sp.]